MTHNVSVTSQGTTTIPAEYRKKYNITQGSRLSVHDNPQTGQIILSVYPTLDEIHQLNETIIKENNLSFKAYKTGDGFRAHVKKRNEP